MSGPTLPLLLQRADRDVKTLLRMTTAARNTQPVVTILQRNLNQYRTGFYESLRSQLQEAGIQLRLVTASGLDEDIAKQDYTSLEWAEFRALREVKVKGTSLLWQPGFDLARDSDLVITEQASKQLFNIFLSFGQRALGTRHAFWGHGRNFQASHPTERGLGEGLKKQLTRRAHWFFSYNELSSAAAIAAGMPATRITATMNSTDTRRIRDQLTSVDGGAIRVEYGFGSGPLALYMGGIAAKKRPEFLIDAAIEIRRNIPDFELVVIGDGPLRDVVNAASERYPWIHALGAIYDDRRIGPASVCSVQLLPGLLGLNVVDGFALGIPSVTLDLDYHSPEIDYLDHEVNGVILPSGTSPERFGSEVAELLNDDSRLTALRSGAFESGELLSVEQMAKRFADGICAALEADHRR